MTLSVWVSRSVTPLRVMMRRAESAVGDGRGVGDEAEDGGEEGVEAEADHDGAADGDGRPAAGRPFEEGAEGEADQHGLDAGVAGQSGHGAAHHVEVAGLHRDVVEQHGVEDGPADGQQPEAGAVDEGHRRLVPVHAVDADGDDVGADGGGAGGLRRQPAAAAPAARTAPAPARRPGAWTPATTPECSTAATGPGAVGRRRPRS